MSITSGTEKKIVPQVAANALKSSVTVLTDGSTVVAFTTETAAGNYRIDLQKFDSTGALIAEEKLSTSQADLPDLQPLAGGKFMASWQEPNVSGSDIFFSVMTANLGYGKFPTNTTTANNQTQSALAGIGSGYVVVWTSEWQDQINGNLSSGIFMQRIGTNIAKIGVEQQVNSTLAGNQSQPAVTGLSDGSFVVVWTSAGQDGGGDGVYMQRFDANGVATGLETKVNSFVAGNQNDAKVTALAGGLFVVTWVSAGQDGSGDGIYQQMFKYNGSVLAKVGGEVLVNTTTAGNQNDPDITVLSGGGWVVVWTDAAKDGSGSGIYAQVFNKDGSKNGGELLVNATTLNDQTSPSVAAGANDSFTISWTGKNAANTGTDIYHRSFGLANDAPSGADATFTMDEDSSYAFKAADFGFSDTGNGNTLLEVQITTLPLKGTLTLNNADVQANQWIAVADLPNLVYKPAKDGFGDGHATISFKVRDDGGTFNNGANTSLNPNTVTFNVKPVNDPPVLATPASVTVSEDSSANGNLQASDADPGATFTYELVNPAAAPTGFTLQSDGSWTFDAESYDALSKDQEQTFNILVTARDNTNLTSANQTLSIIVKGVNDVPTVDDSGITFLENAQGIAGSVTGSDIDTGDTLTYALVDPAGKPDWLTFNADGTYSVNAGAFDYLVGGTQTSFEIAFVANDGKGGQSGVGLLTIKVTGQNDVPVLTAPAEVAMTEDDKKSGQIVVTDPDDANTLKVALVGSQTAPAGFVLNDNGSWSFDTNSYDYLDKDETLVFNLQVQATDSKNATSGIGLLKITITGVNDAPLLTGTPVTLPDVLPGKPVTIKAADLLAGYTDADGQTLAIANLTATHGTLADKGNGTWDFNPVAGYVGKIDLTFNVTDGVEPLAVTRSFSIRQPNIAPKAADQSITFDEDTPRTFTVADFGFADADGDGLKAVIVDGYEGRGTLKLGSASVSSGQTILAADLANLTLTPGKDEIGEAYGKLRFRVVDAGGTANGGTDTSGQANTLTFAVRDVIDTILGTANADKALNGTEGADRMTGLGKGDTISGLAGDDLIDGGKGRDVLNGGDGNDTLFGGLGRRASDTLTGGAGKDAFVFASKGGKDIVTDFQATGTDHDIIDLSYLSAITSFDDLAGHMRTKGVTTIITGDAGEQLKLKGVTADQLDQSHFKFDSPALPPIAAQEPGSHDHLL